MEVFCKKGALKNFAKFIGKHLYQGLFFNKVAGLRPATLLKKRLWHRCFPVNSVKFLRTPFSTEHLRWLPLYLSNNKKKPPEVFNEKHKNRHKLIKHMNSYKSPGFREN